MTAPKWLVGYAAGVTAALGVTLTMGMASRAPADFDEINVQRINVVEPDGTLRMVISNQDRIPGVFHHGVEYENPNRKAAGILFMNDEGSENGGLIFNGYTDEDGVAQSMGHLSFDQYDQDQTFRIFHYQYGDSVWSGMQVSDRPFEPMDRELIDRLNKAETDEERDAIRSEMSESGVFDNDSRVVVSKNRNGAASVDLADGDGRTRLRLAVMEDGTAYLAFLDENGEVVREVTPEG